MFVSTWSKKISPSVRNIGLSVLLLLLVALFFLSPQRASADGGAAPSPTPTSTLAATPFPTPTGEISDAGLLITQIPTEESATTITAEFVGQIAPLPPSDSTATTEASRSALSCWPLAVGLAIVLVILAFFRLQGRGASS